MNLRPADPDSSLPDEVLVARTLDGEREAFRRIVDRYRILICSIAYNATGSVTHSEDIAQETFITGWRGLGQLREPAKLRSWLCGIAHHLVQNRRRNLALEPSHLGATLTETEPAADPSPSEVAIRREHEAILWQALERIPVDYRQPLILFYRQHRSVARVAHDLELSEVVVKQRLSRGRKLLHREVASFVEGTLARTAPDAVFTNTVMGALPIVAASGAAGAGGAMGGASATGLAAKLLLALNVVLGPIIALIAAWLGVRASLAAAEPGAERRAVHRYYFTVVGATVTFTVISSVLMTAAKSGGGLNRGPMFAWLALLLTYVAAGTVFAARLQQNRGRSTPNGTPTSALDPAPSPPRLEFRSRWNLLGLPLVHIRLDRSGSKSVRPAVGWIAVGNCACGILLAWGGIAIGGISGGGLSLGIVSVGAMSVGALAIGGLSIGGHAIGGIAVGWVATGAFAYGWLAAAGRYALAHQFALGVHATAAHVNDILAEQYFKQRPWIDLRTTLGQAVLALVWLPATAAVWHHLRMKRRETIGQRQTSNWKR